MPDQRGWKLKIGVVVPSTNTILQPDFDDLRTSGITNHIGRITLPNMSIKTDNDFDKMVRLSETDMVAAVDRVKTMVPDVLVVGMSSLIVWDGLKASLSRKEMLENRTGVPVTGGSFAGARLNGSVHNGGAAWITQVSGHSSLDVRITLETDDGAIIYMTYKGVVARGDSGLYWRVTPVFNTASEKYDWLNHRVFVGKSKQVEGKVAYDIFEIL